MSEKTGTGRTTRMLQSVVDYVASKEGEDSRVYVVFHSMNMAEHAKSRLMQLLIAQSVPFRIEKGRFTANNHELIFTSDMTRRLQLMLQGQCVRVFEDHYSIELKSSPKSRCGR